MAADIEMADESYSAELDVVGDSRLVQPTNAYGSPLAGASSQRKEMPEEETTSNVAVLNRVVSFGFILYRYQISSPWFESINQPLFYSFPRFVRAKIHVAERSPRRAKVVRARMLI